MHFKKIFTKPKVHKSLLIFVKDGLNAQAAIACNKSEQQLSMN